MEGTKGKRITIRLAEKEFQILTGLCERSQLNPSELIRESLTKITIIQKISEEEKDGIRKLIGMCNNLNQIAKTLNYSKDYELIKFELLDFMIVIESIIKKIKA
jgi:hypothetical protein